MSLLPAIDKFWIIDHKQTDLLQPMRGLYSLKVEVIQKCKHSKNYRAWVEQQEVFANFEKDRSLERVIFK